MFVSGSKAMENTLPSLILCGEALPWVERCVHLGVTLTTDGQMAQDVKEKVAHFIDSTTKTRESFRFAHPTEQICAMEKYCCSIYGSNIWRLENSLTKVMSVWNVAQKMAWNVHRGCCSYLLDNVLAPGSLLMKSTLHTR